LRKELLISFVSAMLLLVMISPINVSVGVVDSSNDSGGFAARSSVDWWHMFRGDLNHAGYSDSVVHDYIEHLWNFSTEDEVWSSPAVVNGRVFVGSKDGYIYALNAATGERENRTMIGAVVSSPAVADGVVFVGSNDEKVYALRETTLEKKWNYSIRSAISCSPAVADGKVFIGSEDGYFYALNATTSNPIHTPIIAGCVRSSPAVSGDSGYVGGDDYVFNFDTDGDEKWKFLVGQGVSVWSSPAVVNDTVFVGVNDGRVYALNATTGKYLWHFETGDAVVSSPAVADGVVFVGSNDTRVYAINASDGVQLWNFTTGGPVVSSPAIASDKVFVGSCDKQIYALNVTDPDGDGIISSEEVIWNFTTGGPVVSSPAIAEGKVFVGSLDNNVYAFRANKLPQASFNFTPVSPIVTQMVTFNASDSYDPDGNITSYTWSFGDGTIFPETKPITNHIYKVAGTYNVTLTLRDDFKPAGTDTTWRLVTVREAWPMFRHDPTHMGNSSDVAPVTNDLLWHKPIGLSDEKLWMYPSAAVVDNKVFFASSYTEGENGTVYALNANDGSEIWSTTPAAGWRIYSSPAVADDLVFIGSENGYLYVLNATNGNPIEWSPVEVSPGTPIYSSPTVAGDRVFVGSQDRSVYAFNKTNGSELWSSDPLGGAIDSSPAVADGNVYVGSTDNKLYCLDAAKGKEIWSYTTGDWVMSSPAVAYGMVFVGSRDDKLYALDALTGEEMWNHTTNGDVDSSPAVAHGVVFIGSRDGNVSALNALTGNEIWNRIIGPIGWSSPAVADGKVFIGSTNEKIYALYEGNGDIAWSYQTGGKVDSSPAVLNDTLYVGSKDGNIYAFRSQPIHDIAVAKVSPSRARAHQGIPINIGVTIRNEGTFTETNINVTTYYYNDTFTPHKVNNTFITSLARGTRITELIQWNTTNVTPGTYNISVYATPVPYEEDKLDNNKTDGPVIIDPPSVIDINVTNVVPFKTIVVQGDSVSINVTVENQGDFTESFNGTVYYNETAIILPDGKNYTTTILTNGTSTTITLTWNTTGVAKGNYTISAEADPLPNEIDEDDNTFTDGVVSVTIGGDVTGDIWVDMLDIDILIDKFMATPSDPPRWDPNCDVNDDLSIDMADISIAIDNFMKEDP
jgi:outer membrane protein assembly factor BamB